MPKPRTDDTEKDKIARFERIKTIRNSQFAIRNSQLSFVTGI
jgi:hypothetical protein